jgi:2,3-dihydroxybenzoate-AMP ligase
MLEGCVPWPADRVKEYKQKGYWAGITLGTALDGWAKKYADKPAIISDSGTFTYSQLDDAATRIAYHMAKLGIKTYDRVVFQLFNCVELVAAFYACLKIGAIPICSLALHRGAEISSLANQSGAVAHILHAGSFLSFDYEEFAIKMQQEAPSLKLVFVVGKPTRSGMHSINDFMNSDIDLKVARKLLTKYRPDPSEPAVFQLSGGTTGTPKIIPRTHDDYLYNLKCVVDRIGCSEDWRSLQLIPVIHNAGLVCGLLPGLMVGASSVFSKSFKAEDILATIQKYKVNTMGAVPVFVHRLMDLAQDKVDKYDTSTFHRFLGAWNPEDPKIYEFMNRYHCDGIQVYGMAEGLICWSKWSDPPEIRHKTQGTPVSAADEVRVVDPETHEEVPSGQSGECWCRGPYTVRGYYKAPERNKEAFTSDGYYRTGDLVRKDSQGNITWSGRIKDCIDRGAEKINAEEVETHILKYPKVKSVAVVGMPDKEYGERICAFVVATSGQSFSLDELNDFLLNNLGVTRFKTPERLEFIDELPITKIGKYEKKTLREKITQKLKQEGKI